ncbi:MAG: type II pantothenate kinase [Oscillospiraceae bacterium]|jgi:type II pantothenate kinase|nr:type II pantothenate kinase [Oscillospiraceae bacterium]
MGIVIGVDVGGSTTKIVGFSPEGGLSGALQVRASDQITSMYGAVGHFMRERALSLDDVEKFVLTGVGASFINENIYGVPTFKTDEFQAIGRGGLYLSGLKKALVASMGTGTAFVRASGDEIVHIGGSGVGGGTLTGLSSALLDTDKIAAILDLAEKGRIENIDLSVKDILAGDIPSLPPDLTAANFGNVSSTASKADFALGIINMVFQTVGLMAAFALRDDEIKSVVLTGSLAEFPQAREVFPRIGGIYGLNFVIPANAVYATAIGAAKSAPPTT